MERDNTGTTLQEEIYRDLLGNLRKGSHYRHHDALPVANLHADVSSLDLPFKSGFPFRIYRPKPFKGPSPVNLAKLKEEDEFLTIMRETKEWEDQLCVFVRLAKKSKAWGEVQKYPLVPGKVSRANAGNPVFAPHPYLKVVKHLEKQPISSFSGTYNWLVTGGCISHCNVGDETVLLAPTGETNDKLGAFCLKNRQNDWCISKSQIPVNAPLFKDERIFQTVATNVADKGVAAARQLKSCSIVLLQSNSEESISAHCTLEIREDKNIFTSVDLCPDNPNFCCTLDSDHLLKVWDLHKSSYTVRGHVRPIKPTHNTTDKWGFVKFGKNSNELLICNRHDVLVKDLRAPLTNNIQQFSVSNILNSCEALTYLLPTQSNFDYVASSHYLLTLDHRAGWVQRWTHFLHMPPVFGAVQRSQSADELILLSSYLPNDCTALFNSYEGGKPQSDTFPTCLPSIGDCLFWAQAQGKCLGWGFSRRFKMCTAGITLLPSESNCSLTSITSTSIGDIFSQRFTVEASKGRYIKPYSTEEQDELDLATWRAWEEAHNAISNENCPPLKCPAVSRENLIRCASAPASNYELQRRAEAWKKTFGSKASNAETVPSPNWTETTSQLKSFNDLMAGLLLDPWISSHISEEEKLSKDTQSAVTGKYYETPFVNHNFPRANKRTPSPDDSGSELDSASVLENTVENISQQTRSQIKKRKRESQGF